MFDRQTLRLRRARMASPKAGFNDFLLSHAALEIAERLAVVNRQFDNCIAYNANGGMLARAIRETGKAEQVITADFVPAVAAPCQPALVFDEEILPLREAHISLIVSALTLHWMNDLPGALIQARRALRPDGLFIAALLGGDTLMELRQSLLQAETELCGGVSPRIAQFADVRDLGGLLQRAGFALPVVDSDRLTARYDTAFDLMADLQAMGATNIMTGRSKTATGRRLFSRMAEIYHDTYAHDDGRIPATFQIIYLTGWAPHESQQKPLRPGSAKTRLADALGTEEIKLKG